MGNRFSQTVDLNYPFGPVFDAAVWASVARKGSKVNRTDHSTGLIVAFTRTSAWSWGEQISIQVYPKGPTHTQAHIESKSSLPFTLVDWGINRKNVVKIVADLHERIQQIPPLDMSQVPPANG